MGALQRIQRIQRRVEAFRRLAPPAPSSRSSDFAALSLEAFIRASGLQAPHHLHHLLDEAELAIAARPQGKRFFWYSVPPRHWKTFTLRHVAAAHMLRHPTQNVVWCSHTFDFATDQSIEIRKIVERMGGRLDPETQRKTHWRMAAGGGLQAFGSGGAIAGVGGRLIVVDDPIGKREQAESQIERDKLAAWLEDDVIPRLTPDGALILVHTRWHPDDPIGRFAADSRWRGVNVPALAEERDDPLARAPGEPLRPDIISRDELEGLRLKNVFKFASLYQGRPRPRGASVFNGNPLRFSRLPDGAHRTAYGVDLAYTAKTVSDRSVCLRMQRFGDVTYVTAGRIAQVAAPEFTLTLRAMAAEQDGAMRWYRSGTEKGAAQFIKTRVPGFRDLPTTGDKFVRAQGAAGGWNAGQLAFPAEDSPLYGDWVDAALDELAAFTGVRDAHDDIVDALAAGWDELNPKRGERSVTIPGGQDRHDRTVY